MAKKLNHQADSSFFASFQENEELIVRYTRKLTRSYGCRYPVNDEESYQDMLSHVRDELSRLDSLNKHDPSRGSFSSYLFHQILNITGTHYRARVRHQKVLAEAQQIPVEDLTLKESYITEDNTFSVDVLGIVNASESLDPELMKDLVKILDPEELKLVMAIAEEDLKGQDLYDRVQKQPMAISRMKKALRSKLRGALMDHGIAVHA